MSAPYRIQAIAHMQEQPEYYDGMKFRKGRSYPITTFNNRLADEYKQWCKEVLGQDNWNYFGEWRLIPYQFCFKREEDLLAFKLKFDL